MKTCSLIDGRMQFSSKKSFFGSGSFFEMISCVVLTLVSLGVVIYVYLSWTFDYWLKRGVKGPKPRPLVGNFPSVFNQKCHLVEEINEIYKQYKNDEDFVGVFSMRTPQLIVLNPEYAKRVYVNDFRYFRDNEASRWLNASSDKLLAHNPFMLPGELWKERRQDIAPAFSPIRIKSVFSITNEVCGRLVEFIREKSSKAGPDGIDAKDVSLRFTSDVVSDYVLGLKTQSLTENPTEILGMVSNLFEVRPFLIFFTIVASIFPVIRDYYRARFFSKKLEDFFLGLMASAFKMRRENKIDRTDFINYILDLQAKKNMSDEMAASHTMTFLTDGYETTATVIAHCLLQLAREPACQEKLRQEIETNVKDGETRIDFETISSLPYLDQCLHESIRLVPSLLMSSRLCTEPREWVNRKGNHIKFNLHDNIIVPIYSLHYDEEFFPDPERFISERFDPENGGIKKFRDMGVFYPFGDGPRTCLGMRFALTQTKAAIAEIVRNFNLKVNQRTRADNKLNPKSFVGELLGGVWLDFEERK